MSRDLVQSGSFKSGKSCWRVVEEDRGQQLSLLGDVRLERTETN